MLLTETQQHVSHFQRTTSPSENGIKKKWHTTLNPNNILISKKEIQTVAMAL